MKTTLDLHVIDAGSCRHPEIMMRRDRGLAPVDIPALAFLLVHPVEGPILFDTGYDPAFHAATRPFPERAYALMTPVKLAEGQSAAEQMSARGYAPEDLRHVVLSHFHGDHMAGLHAFPNATVHCARAGLDRAQRLGRISGTRHGILKALIPDDIDSRAAFFEDKPSVGLPSDFAPFETGADLLGDGSVLAVPLPGHCPGHWGVALRQSSGAYAFLVADAAWSTDAIRANVPPPRLTTAFLGETKPLRETLSRLSALSRRNPDMQLLPSHCPEVAAVAWTDES